MAKRRRRQDPLEMTAATVRDYSTHARNLCSENFKEISETIPELRRALRPIIGYRRTALVLVPMRVAAELNKNAAAHSSAVWWAFLKHFFAEVFGGLNVNKRGRR